jgi:hypothetical protein
MAIFAAQSQKEHRAPEDEFLHLPAGWIAAIDL